MSLRLENISKSFGNVAVLHGASCVFTPGTVSAIVGDNGAGKSTLLKTIAGISRPDGGVVFLNNRNITDLSPHQRREQGMEMVFQDLALAKQQSAVRNIFMGKELAQPFTGLRYDGRMRARTAAALQRLGIRLDSIDMPVEKLSGGQQQSVALARALLDNPQVLLLDEPTAALGAREVEQLLNLIRQERDRGCIIVLVSHRFNDIFAVADRVIVLKHGRIFDDRPAAETTVTDTVERIVS